MMRTLAWLGLLLWAASAGWATPGAVRVTGDGTSGFVDLPASSALTTALASGTGLTFRYAVTVRSGQPSWMATLFDTHGVERAKFAHTAMIQSGTPASHPPSGANLTAGDHVITGVFLAPTPGDAGYIRLFRDGAQVANVALAAGTATSWGTGPHRLRLIRGPSSGADFDVYDIGVWTRALSNEEVAALDAPATRSRLSPAQKADAALLWYGMPDIDTPGTIPNSATGAGALALSATWSGGPWAFTAEMPEWADPAMAEAPTVAAVLSSEFVADVRIGLAWTAVPGAKRYNVYRGGSLQATVTGSLAWLDETVAASTAYAYTVRAENDHGEGPASNTLEVTTPTPDTTDPTPGAVTLTTRTDRTLTVNVGAGSDNRGIWKRTLRVYSDAGLSTQVGPDLAATVGDNTITGLLFDTPYWVQVTYQDYSGNTATATLATATDPLLTFPVAVYPGHRNASISFDMREAAPQLYDATQPAPWVEQGRVMLWLSTDGGSTWKRQQDFVREHRDRIKDTGVPPSPTMSAGIFGLAESTTYHYRITCEAPWPETAVVEGTFTTRGEPTLGPNVVTVMLNDTETASDRVSKISAAWAGGADVVEVANEAGAGVPLTIRGAFNSYYSTNIASSGTANAWKSLRVKDGHRVIIDMGVPAYDVPDNGMWTLYTDAARGITADHKVYKSATAFHKDNMAWVFYERAPNEPAVQFFLVNKGMKSGDSFAFSGWDAATPAAISTISGGIANITNHSDIDHGMLVEVSGNSNPALNKQWRVDWASRDYGDVAQMTPRLADPVTGIRPTETGTGGTMTPVGPQSRFLTRIGKDAATMIFEPTVEDPDMGHIYVHLNGGIDPNTVPVKFPSSLAYNSAMLIPMTVRGPNIGTRLSYFVVDGFEIDSSSRGGLDVSYADHVVVRNMRVWNTGGNWVMGRDNSYVTIRDCDFRERGAGPDPYANPIPTPHWRYSKTSYAENVGIGMNIAKGVGTSLIDNHMEGAFNGISPSVGGNTWTDWATGYLDRRLGTVPVMTEVDGCEFVGIGDDAIEPEQYVVNQIFTNNRFRKCFMGISTAPIIGGPVYILRNVWLTQYDFAGTDYGVQSFVKFGNDDPGDVGYKMIAHNTVVGHNPDPEGAVHTGIFGQGGAYNYYWYNNLIYSDGLSIASYSAFGYPHIFDGNRWVQKRPGDRTGFGSPQMAGFAVIPHALRQGDERSPATGNRWFPTFLDWQKGEVGDEGWDMPGYTGTVPTTPVTAMTPGSGTYPAQEVIWLHDPHGSYGEGDHELTNPALGTVAGFTPAVTANIVGAAVNLPGITDPGLTVGAVPIEPENYPAVLKLGRGAGSGVSGNVVTWGEIKAAGGLSLLVRSRSDLYIGNAGSIQEVFRLYNVATGHSLIRVNYQNSPYIQFNLHTRSGGRAHPSSSFGVMHFGTPNYRDFTDHVFTILLPDNGSEGHIRAYRDGALEKESNGGEVVPFDFEIASDFDMGWLDTDEFRVVIGEATEVNQDHQLFDLALWGGARDAAFIANINRKPLVSLDATARADSSLMLWYRPTDELWTTESKTIPNSATGASALANASVTFSGNVSIVSNPLPAYAGFGALRDTTPPTPGAAPSVLAVADTTATVEVPGMGTDIHGVTRTLYVTKGNTDYRKLYIQRQSLTTETSVALTGLVAGTDYKAVLEYADLYDNVTTQTVAFTTTGTASFDRRSLGLVGQVDAVDTPAIRFPFMTDGLALSFWVKRNAGDTGDHMLVSIMDDGYLYKYFIASVDATGKPYVNQGGGVRSITSYISTVAIGTGAWEHWVIGIDYPTVLSAGGFRFYRNGVLVSGSGDSLPIVTSWLTDHSPGKWVPKIRLLSSNNASSNMYVADMALYTAKVGDVAAAVSGKGPGGIPDAMRANRIVAWGSPLMTGLLTPTDGTATGSMQGWLRNTSTQIVWTGESKTASSVTVSADIPAWDETLSSVPPAPFVASVRSRIGVQMAVAIGATDADGTIAGLAAAVAGPSGTVSHTSDPVTGLGTNSASSTIYFTPMEPGAYTVTAVATDNQANEGQAQAVSRARRGTTSVIVVQ